jgi:hypothetical protein
MSQITITIEDPHGEVEKVIRVESDTLLMNVTDEHKARMLRIEDVLTDILNVLSVKYGRPNMQ